MNAKDPLQSGSFAEVVEVDTESVGRGPDDVEVWTWRAAIRDSKLSARAKHTALTLSTWMSRWCDSCYPSVKQIADAMSRTKDYAIDGIAELEHGGFVRVIRPEKFARGHANVYLGTLPASVDAAERSTESTDAGEVRRAAPFAGSVDATAPSVDTADRHRSTASTPTLQEPLQRTRQQQRARARGRS